LQARSQTTIAVLGGNTVAGLALSLLLKGAGYKTVILRAPPELSTDPLGDVDLLLVAPGLGGRRREKSLAALRGAEGRLRVPVLTFTSTIEEGLFGDEAAGVTWPVEVGGLIRGIEATIGGETETGPAMVANPVVGGVALKC
jgi:hypothetical protein